MVHMAGEKIVQNDDEVKPRFKDFGQDYSKPCPQEMERIGPCLVYFFINVFCPYMTIQAGWQPHLFRMALGVWFLQMIGIGICNHRYFSHRGFRAGRLWTFCMAMMGVLAGQGGPLTWASMHRWHHRHCESTWDHHSTRNDGSLVGKLRGFFRAQGGFLVTVGMPYPDFRLVADWAKYPELVFLDKVAAALYFGIGAVLGGLVYSQKLSFEFMAYAYFFPTVVSFNGVMFINSAAHLVGEHKYHDPFAPDCDSRNVWWLTPIMLGSNWHANHHSQPQCAREGFEWWELDPLYWVLCVWEKLGLVYDLKQPDPLKKKHFLISKPAVKTL